MSEIPVEHVELDLRIVGDWPIDVAERCMKTFTEAAERLRKTGGTTEASMSIKRLDHPKEC